VVEAARATIPLVRDSVIWGIAACLLLVGLDVYWDFTSLPSCLTTPAYAWSFRCPSVVVAGTTTSSNPLMRVVTDPATYVRARQNRDVLALFCFAMAAALAWFLGNLGAVERDIENKHDGRAAIRLARIVECCRLSADVAEDICVRPGLKARPSIEPHYLPSATIGSIRLARHAGIVLATSATTSRISVTTVNTTGSRGATPNNSLFIN
jgi:hypothetical protein